MLSDRYLEKGKLPVHALLATGAVHHHLVQPGYDATPISSLKPAWRGTHTTFACLIGYGATAVYPYLVYQSLHDIATRGNIDKQQQLGRSYRRGIRKGLFKSDVEDGHLVDLELSRRAAVRDCGHAPGSRRPLFPRHDLAHPGHGL